MTALDSPVFVLDSFAVLAFFQDEPAAERVDELLSDAAAGKVRLFMAVVNLGEAFYKTFKRFGEDRADEVLGILQTQYSIEFADVDRDLALRGAQVKGRYAMSYADCIAAALARQLGATLVTGDPEFEAVEHLLMIEWLPQR